MRFIPEEINKIALSSDDDKQVIMIDGIHTFAYGHTNLKTIVNKKMSYNEIPNILVDSVVLPNKPISNLKIIDAAKNLSLYGFRGVFLRDSLPTKKLNECGISNIDSFSGDGTHWVMWFKKGKDKFYFDSYGVQSPRELIAYPKPPIFYNSERVHQNGEVFCGHLYLFAWKQLSLGHILQAIINYLI